MANGLTAVVVGFTLCAITAGRPSFSSWDTSWDSDDFWVGIESDIENTRDMINRVFNISDLFTPDIGEDVKNHEETLQQLGDVVASSVKATKMDPNGFDQEAKSNDVIYFPTDIEEKLNQEHRKMNITDQYTANITNSLKTGDEFFKDFEKSFNYFDRLMNRTWQQLENTVIPSMEATESKLEDLSPMLNCTSQELKDKSVICTTVSGQLPSSSGWQGNYTITVLRQTTKDGNVSNVVTRPTNSSSSFATPASFDGKSGDENTASQQQASVSNGLTSHTELDERENEIVPASKRYEYKAAKESDERRVDGVSIVPLEERFISKDPDDMLMLHAMLVPEKDYSEQPATPKSTAEEAVQLVPITTVGPRFAMQPLVRARARKIQQGSVL